MDAASTLNLGGNFATANLGTLNFASGSTINITGNWTNTGQTFNFTSATGFWNLDSGTIIGGTLTVPAGQSLPVVFGANNLLSGVAITGDISLNGNTGEVQIGGGTTFATAHLTGGNASFGFQNGQTLGGGATVSTISFENGSNSEFVESVGTGSAFTVGSNGVIQTAAGFTGTASIRPSNRYGGTMNLSNQGLISDQAANATLTINPLTFINASGGIVQVTASKAILNISSTSTTTPWSNLGTIKVQGGSTANFLGSWSNLGGTVNVDATSTLNLGGNFATANLGTLNFVSGSTVNITGNWTNTGQTFNFTSATGFWTLDNGTITGGTLTVPAGQSLPVVFGSNNQLSAVAITGDISVNGNTGETQIGGGTTFTTAHLTGGNASLGFQNNQTLGGGATGSTVSFENGSNSEFVESVGTGSALTVGANGVIQTAAGFTGTASIGPSNRYGGTMNLSNQGLISNQAANATLTINPLTFTNALGGIVQVTASKAVLNINSTSASGWNNLGTINVQGGSTANFLGAWSNLQSTVNVDATSTLNLGGNFAICAKYRHVEFRHRQHGQHHGCLDEYWPEFQFYQRHRFLDARQRHDHRWNLECSRGPKFARGLRQQQSNQRGRHYRRYLPQWEHRRDADRRWHDLHHGPPDWRKRESRLPKQPDVGRRSHWEYDFVREWQQLREVCRERRHRQCLHRGK